MQQKGQFQLEILESGAPAGATGKPSVITICTENAIDHGPGARRSLAQSGCKQRLLKDTADEAVIETLCPDSKVTQSYKRQGNTMLAESSVTGQRATQILKWRSTYLGPCKEGQAGMTTEQCRKLKEQHAKVDPVAACAHRKSNREACEQRLREQNEMFGSLQCG